jgi:hypothetical protein
VLLLGAKEACSRRRQADCRAACHRGRRNAPGTLPYYPAPADFISPLLTCHSFLPRNPGNLNAAEFCNPRIDAQVTQALAVRARNPSTAVALWARIDHQIVNQAP